MIRMHPWPMMGLALALGTAASACNDVGDNTGTGNNQGQDATSSDGSEVDDGAASDTGSDQSLPGDGGSTDGDSASGQGDAVTTEDGGADSPAMDSPAADSTAVDAPAQETGGQDAGGVDASEAGAVDSGGVDSTVAESGVDAAPDAGPDSAGEAGVDAGPDALPDSASDDAGDGGGVVPCTSASQTSCIRCDGNTDGLCTPTEALFLAHDIEKGQVDLDAGVPDLNTSCYECLWNAGCIDDELNPDTGKECGDLTGTVGAGAESTETKTDACLATLSCTLGSGCANAKAQNGSTATDGISNCFCGSSYVTTTLCQTATSSAPPNGSCYQTDLDGLGDTASTPISNVLGAFTTRTSGAGMANAIFQCAGSNMGAFICPTCF